MIYHDFPFLNSFLADLISMGFKFMRYDFNIVESIDVLIKLGPCWIIEGFGCEAKALSTANGGQWYPVLGAIGLKEL